MQPLIKWAGGKQKLLAQIMPHVPKDFDTYYEQFFGGGAVFFALEPRKAVLTDINSELINFYEMVRDEVPFLISEIDTYENTEEFYYRKRELDRSVEYRSLTNIQRAARFLYLNKTCFNGLYRVNKEGYFNTPFGKYKNPKFYDKDRIKKAFHLFNSPNNIEIKYGDLSEAKNASSDDFVYFDPPYVPLTKTSSFTAVKMEGYLINTGSAVTATLPASPTIGLEVRLIDATGQAATNNITVARNSEKIQGVAENLTISTNRAAICLVYYNTANGWVLREN